MMNISPSQHRQHPLSFLTREQCSLASSDSLVSLVSSAARPGVMLLLTVLITGAVALTVSIHLALRGIGELDMGFAGSQSQKVFALTEGCLEEALFALSRDPSYGGGELRFGEGACRIEVRGNGAEREMLVRGAIDRWVRKVEVEVDISTPSVTLLDWREIP